MQAPAYHARLRELADEHYEFVWRSLRRLGVRPPETDDAAQRVFLILAQKLSSIQPDKERSFVFGVVMRVASNVRRDLATARAREVAESESPESIAQGPTAESAVAQAEERATLDEILAGIPAERRAVFILFELEELTLTEIAELLGLPVGTAATRLRRARQEFQASVARLHARGQGGMP
ncbi:MAG: sigma-70 family RNA polymerase sigma factor [Labilithrix sp.]|nr:sigma-70 family RNA polymerase sigma factor [Labilithrix sp.]